jgi:SAM-dependent methyltransferase
VSWYQREPAVSLRLVDRTPGSVVDVGAGASTLVDALLDAGRTDLTLVDLSAEALDVTRARLGTRAEAVTFVVGDVLAWSPGRTFDVWHDRAVFHFLTDAEDQHRYVQSATRAVAPGGALVMGTFAPDGPTHCSGLETARHDAGSLEALFSDGFRPEHAESETHLTPWDAEQHFTWVLLRRAPAWGRG